MTKTDRTALRQLLVDGYDEFAQLLKRRLGSKELAAEAIQDTFLRLERGGDLGEVRSSRGYLIRMMVNVAHDRWRAENRRMTVSEGDAFLDIVDDTPSPENTAEARSELAMLERILEELPLRRRKIFEAAWVEELGHPQIAARFGIALRTVQQELKLAREYCAARLGSLR